MSMGTLLGKELENEQMNAKESKQSWVSAVLAGTSNNTATFANTCQKPAPGSPAAFTFPSAKLLIFESFNVQMQTAASEPRKAEIFTCTAFPAKHFHCVTIHSFGLQP